MKNTFLKLTKCVVWIVDIIRIMLKFIQYYPEVMDTLNGMPLWEAFGCVFYVGIIIYQWLDYIKRQHPFLRWVLTHYVGSVFYIIPR